MSQQSRSAETQALFLTAVGKHLSERGETALKLAGICTEVGMSQTAIYYHFGSREAVIDAAYLQIYEELMNLELAMWRKAIAESDLNNICSHYVTQRITCPSAFSTGLPSKMHIQILSASTVRKGFKTQYDAANQKFLDALTVLFQGAIDRGAISGNLSARQIALLVECLLINQRDSQFQLAPSSDWNKTVEEFFGLLSQS